VTNRRTPLSRHVAAFVAACLVLITLFPGGILAAPPVPDEQSEAFQIDADTVRLRHLRYYSDLIEEYHATTGAYPFVDEADIPIYVYVATPEQQKYTGMNPPHAHRNKSFRELVLLLEQALERGVAEHYDPQQVPLNKPVWYLYTVHQGTWSFAVYLRNPFSFADNIGLNLYKVAVSNSPAEENGAWDSRALFSRKDFELAEQRKLSQPRFFAELEAGTLHGSKEQ